MFLISSCSRGKILTVGTGHSETWSGKEIRFPPCLRAKHWQGLTEAERRLRPWKAKAELAWTFPRSEVRGSG